MRATQGWVTSNYALNLQHDDGWLAGDRQTKQAPTVTLRRSTNAANTNHTAENQWPCLFTTNMSKKWPDVDSNATCDETKTRLRFLSACLYREQSISRRIPATGRQNRHLYSAEWFSGSYVRSGTSTYGRPQCRMISHGPLSSPCSSIAPSQ